MADVHQGSRVRGPLAVRLGRRDALRLGTMLAAWGMSALVPVGIAWGRRCDRARGTVTTTYRGSSPFGYDQWASLDFDVPAGVRRISVSTSFAPPEFPSRRVTWPSGLDTGVFGPDGFRGWSGEARRECTLSAADATPGYLPGPIEAGKWSVALGPTVSDPQGMDWQVDVTLEYGDPLLPACGARAAHGPDRQGIIRLRAEVSAAGPPPACTCPPHAIVARTGSQLPPAAGRAPRPHPDRTVPLGGK
ncbi:hypothetical protein [Streptomyces sp. NBC_01264]|uniref:hypothetical protein n=1 Tax=Streptomyces sp. NBC_01264 TaxID=2903804 RepID=UPI002256BFC0|nr:hypothetical protein [Streptomyces sp. NBC_01264]MCX4781762.1 hypothetical protein [Streptomyces sp. NBC_01264]